MSAAFLIAAAIGAKAEPLEVRLAHFSLPEPPDRMPPAQEGRQITIVLTGDFGLAPHLDPVHPESSAKHGLRLNWSEMLERVRGKLEGDVRFTNIETVISDRTDLRPEPKAFNFKSHPEGVRHFVRNGFNVFSLANNHALDYGLAGLNETLRHAEGLKSDGLLAWSGVGRDRDEAARSALFEVKGMQLSFAAIGILSQGHGHHRATTTRPGQLSYRASEDFDLVTQNLAASSAAYKILSVHFGVEMSVEPTFDQIRNARDIAVRGRGIDLVAGHHAHVVQPIEMVDGRLIFYGLGNFLHLGTQDMSRAGMCRDFGIVARVHLAETAAGRLEARAVELIPIRGTHIRPEPMPVDAARDRIAVVNHLADRIDTRYGGRYGLRFAAESDGRGLYCTPEASKAGGRIGELCRNWSGPSVTPPELVRRIANACAPTQALSPVQVSRLSKNGRLAEVDQRARPRQKQSSFLSGLFGD